MTIATLDRLATPLIYAGVAVLLAPLVGPMIGGSFAVLGWRLVLAALTPVACTGLVIWAVVCIADACREDDRCP